MIKRDDKRIAMIKEFILFCFISSFTLPAYGGTGASFLKLGVGSRAIGMGSAFTAVSDDVTALCWNPAGLSQLKKREVGAMYADLYGDAKFNFVGYAHPLGVSKGVIGISAAYLSQGSIEGRTEDRSRASDFSADDLAVTIGVGKLIAKKASLGVNVKLLQSKISGYSSTGFALDAGFLSSYSLGTCPLSLGFALQNIGPQMKYVNQSYSLPLTLAGGVSLPTQCRLPLSFSADLKHQPYDSKTTFSVGTEFSPVSILSLRAGYLANAVKSAGTNNNSFSEKLSNLSGLGLGVGFKLGPAAVDYSFTPAGELGNTQRVSLSLQF